MALAAAYNDKQFKVGDTIRVSLRVSEEGKTRTQNFDGIVIGIKGENARKSISVRRVGAGGVGIERIFPLALPTIDSIEILSRGRVRRAKLYYLRDKSAREIAKLTRRQHARKQATLASEAKRTSPSKKKKTSAKKK